MPSGAPRCRRRSRLRPKFEQGFYTPLVAVHTGRPTDGTRWTGIPRTSPAPPAPRRPATASTGCR